MTMDAPSMVIDAPSMTMDAPSMVIDAPSMVVDMTPVSQGFWTPRIFYGHGLAKYPCPSHARIFKGTRTMLLLRVGCRNATQ
jgi:hypothetical protein